MFAPTENELIRLLSGVNLRSVWGQRDYLQILFPCHTGLRVGEMTKLQVQWVAHLGAARDEVYIPAGITKGKEGARRSRTVPLNPVAQECVQKLLEFNRRRGFSVEPTAPLFPWKRHEFLPIREAERTIQRLREKVGLSAKITPHTFRHFFATRLVAAGVDLATVQSLLGHETLSSTQVYTHTTEARRRAAVMVCLGRLAA